MGDRQQLLDLHLNTSLVEHPSCFQKNIFFGATERGALTCWDGDAGGDADAVVNDSKHVDIVFHTCLKARDGAGGGVAWNPNL